ncbi:unnamed protein product [Arabidopsis halleri]
MEILVKERQAGSSFRCFKRHHDLFLFSFLTGLYDR